MTRFAAEYGTALFELAEDEHITEPIAEQLREITALLEREKDYIRLLDAQSIEVRERKGLVDEAFGASVHPYLLNFMKLLIDRGAIAYLPECAKVYREKFNSLMGIAEAEVTSATALSPEQIEAIREKLCKISGKKVEMRIHVDPELIGGLSVELMGKRYDNSVRTQLKKLRSSLD